MTELWGNGGKVLADHASYTRLNLGAGLATNDARTRSAAESANAVFVKALWREIYAIQRRMRA